MHTTTGMVVRGILLLGMAIMPACGTGCTHIAKTFPIQPQQKQVSKPVNPKAQKYYYELGLQLYSKESYNEARNAFLMVIENGPNTTLGSKAQDNIVKIDQVLKTVEDIQAK